MEASKIIFLVLLSTLFLCVADTKRVKAQDFVTIYILADGRVKPSTAPISSADNVTYTFTSNIIGSSIVILRDNIVVDGASYQLQGQGEIGIELSYRKNVTIRNMQIRGFLYYGIFLWSSFSNKITGNTVAYNMGGIMIQNASNNIISGNLVTNNLEGIMLEGSLDNNVSGNTITNNDRGISFYSSSNNVLKNNRQRHFFLFFFKQRT